MLETTYCTKSLEHQVCQPDHEMQWLNCQQQCAELSMVLDPAIDSCRNAWDASTNSNSLHYSTMSGHLPRKPAFKPTFPYFSVSAIRTWKFSQAHRRARFPLSLLWNWLDSTGLPRWLRVIPNLADFLAAAGSGAGVVHESGYTRSRIRHYATGI